DQAGQLDMGFFQQRLHLVLQSRPITRQLILFSASPFATDVVRHRAQSSKSIPGPPAASRDVRHRGNPSSALPALGSPVPAPDAVVAASGVRLLVCRVSASNTFPALPTLVSNIGPSIP